MATLNIFTAEELSPKILDYFSDYGHQVPEEFSLAGKAASSRLYFRIPGEHESWVLMQVPELDAEFDRFIEMTSLLSSKGIAVPQIYVVDREYHQMLIQDLGTNTLWDTWQFTQDLERYRDVIDQLIAIQEKVLVTEDTLSEPKVFDVPMLEWETNYFFDNYLVPYKKISDTDAIEMKNEFADLAKKVDQHTKVMMHRDFQSQNIMLHNDTCYVIDYQGARLGSWCYDLASLLWDPYVMLPYDSVLELTRYFHANSDSDLSYGMFFNEFIEASLQRVMQACGAYCFLSDTKGKEDFKQFLEPGLGALSTILKQYDGLPTLKKILSK